MLLKYCWLVLGVVSFGVRAENTEWIRSDRYSNLGAWGKEERCPTGFFVNSINLKIEDFKLNNDDTSLNGVLMHCTEVIYGNNAKKLAVPRPDEDNWKSDEKNNPSKYIHSEVGSYGYYHGWQNCPNGGLAIGFKFKVEWHDSNIEDNTAANDVQLVCMNSAREERMTTPQGGKFGNWTVRQKTCSKGMAFCGIKTQVQPSQGSKDDTSLNNLDVLCCKLPNPAKMCTPRDEWVQVIEQQNKAASRDMRISVQHGVGLSQKPSGLVNEAEAVTEAIAFDNPHLEYRRELLKELNIRFANLHQTIKTGYTWLASNKAFTNYHTVQMDAVIKAGCTYKVEQVVGRCGTFEVMTERIKISTFCPESNQTE